MKAAKLYGLQTGGWIPRGFKTYDGPHPEYAELYGLVETPEEDYVARTILNTRDSDATIRFAKDMQSAGEKCTLKGIKMFKRPYYDIHLGKSMSPQPLEAVELFIQHPINVLNIAGNRESTSPGIEQYTIDFLLALFAMLEKEGLLEKR